MNVANCIPSNVRSRAEVFFVYSWGPGTGGIISACGAMGREIESRQGICRVVAFKKRNIFRLEYLYYAKFLKI
jgi:hypothetical protein